MPSLGTSHVKYLFVGAVLCLVFATPAGLAAGKPTTPKWQKVAPGVWRAQVGKPESLTLLGAAGSTPAIEALKRLPEAVFPLDEKQIKASQWDWKTALRFPLALNEDVYGLGVDFKTMRRTGSIFQLHVDHWGGQTGRTHAPV